MDTPSPARAPHRRTVCPSLARVTYWTSWLSPEMEGLSKEVFSLKDYFPRSRIFGLSHAYVAKWSMRQRYFGLNAHLYPLFRVLAPLWDATSDINHIYGDLTEWFFLKALRRRPIVVTVATNPASPLARERYAHVRRFVTHGPGAATRLREWGFDASMVSEIYPGIDLRRFGPAPRTDAASVAGLPHGHSRFRILFATTPHVPQGMRIRGVDLMLAAAARLPEVDFVMLWRPLPGVGPLIDRCRREAPTNVHISTDVVEDMPAMFHACDATIAPFTEEVGMKACPTSLVESLACGRPVLVSTMVGVSHLVRAEGCGEVFEPALEHLVEAIHRLTRDHADRSRRARPTAEKYFDIEQCRAAYAEIYEDVMRESSTNH